MTEKKQHPHAEFLRAIADGEPLDAFEIHENSWPSFHFVDFQPIHLGTMYIGRDKWQVRRKQNTIRIGDMDVPEPMRVAPAKGTEYWLVSPTGREIWRYFWSGDSADHQWLESGLCHATKEAAEAHRRALILVSGGTP